MIRMTMPELIFICFMGMVFGVHLGIMMMLLWKK